MFPHLISRQFYFIIEFGAYVLFCVWHAFVNEFYNWQLIQSVDVMGPWRIMLTAILFILRKEKNNATFKKHGTAVSRKLFMHRKFLRGLMCNYYAGVLIDFVEFVKK